MMGLFTECQYGPRPVGYGILRRLGYSPKLAMSALCPRMQSVRSLLGQPYRPIVLSRKPPTSSCAPYRKNQKTLLNQCSCWIPVAPGAPSDLAKSTEVRLTKNDSISTAYESRTKSGESGGLENNGQRERFLGLDRCAAVRRFVRKARGYWASMRARKPPENVGGEQTGGGSATGIQRSLNLQRLNLPEGEELESNCPTENTTEYAPVPISVSLG
jgi:hypothetical protein